MTKSKKIAIIVSAVIIVGMIISLGCILLTLNSEHSSKRSDFPVLEPSPFLLTNEVAFEDQVEASELVVEATVQKVYPIEQRVLIPQKGSPEAAALAKNGDTSIVYNALVVEMKADDYIKGNAGETFKMSIVAYHLDSSPDFNVGDRFLLTLGEYVDGTYSPVTHVSSYFFVADDNKIYPAGNDTPTLKYSGMDLFSAKRDISIISEKSKTKS